jgi:hypothetical protein
MSELRSGRKTEIMKKLLLSIAIFVAFASNVFAQKFEGTYESSGFSIILIKSKQKYDGEITYGNKKIVVKSSVVIATGGGSYSLNISADKGGGLFGNNSQSATLKLLSNGDLMWENRSFSGMPTGQFLKRKESHSATQSAKQTKPKTKPKTSQQPSQNYSPQTQTTQSQTIIINGSNNGNVIIQNSNKNK